MSGLDIVVMSLGALAIGVVLRAAILVRLFQLDCPHRTVSFPMRRRDGIDRCTCLDCGKVLEYRALTKCDWLN